MTGPKNASLTQPDNKPLSYKNRKGVVYYLNAGRTKTGKPRYYFTRHLGEGVLAQMPDGYEVTESINAVVSVRRCGGRRSRVEASELALVEAALRRQPHLRHHRAIIAGDAIVVHESDFDESIPALLIDRLSAQTSAVARGPIRHARYSPVFELAVSDSIWTARRMTYRGHGGWSYPLASGPLAQLIKRFVPVLGTDAFFELI